MSYLTDDLARLTRYAQGLGLRVSIKEHAGDGTGAEWLTDGVTQEIVLYRWNRQTKTRMVLNLLHELAHHLSFVYSGRKISKTLLKALDMEDSRSKSDPVIPKRYRKLIYESEVKDAEFREIIAHETNLKIPMWKIKADKELDIWLYKCYYDTGSTPTLKASNEKYKELKDKYRNET